MPVAMQGMTLPKNPFFDRQAQGAVGNRLAGVALTTTQDVGPNAYGIITVSGRANAGAKPGVDTFAVTIGGTALSSLGYVFINNETTTYSWAWVFGGAVPAGIASTVSVTLNAGGTANWIGNAASCTYRNVANVGSLQTAYGVSNHPTLAVTSAAGHLVWGNIHYQTATENTPPVFTTRQTGSAIAGVLFHDGDVAAAGSPVTVGATLSAAVRWAVLGLDLS